MRISAYTEWSDSERQGSKILNTVTKSKENTSHDTVGPDAKIFINAIQAVPLWEDQ